MATEFTSTITRTYIVDECHKCSVLYAMLDTFIKERRRDHATFYCPNGHPAYYPSKNPEEKLRDELAEVRRSLGEQMAEKQKAQRKAARLEARAKAGMCAKCGRTFRNYARHMEDKHGEKKAANRGV